MSDRYSHDTYDYDRRDLRRRDDDDRRRDDDRDRDFRERPDEPFPPLPVWLQAKLLGDGETVEWVRGPRFNPFWERYATHPLLFVFGLAVGGLLLATGIVFGGPKSDLFGATAALGLVTVIGSIFVLALFSGFFTRLIVTTRRVVVMQGYEIVRSWDMDQLPRSMLRYRAGSDGERSPSIDLATVKTMLGGSADGFADSKTILAFSKQLNNIIKKNDDTAR